MLRPTRQIRADKINSAPLAWEAGAQKTSQQAESGTWSGREGRHTCWWTRRSLAWNGCWCCDILMAQRTKSNAASLWWNYHQLVFNNLSCAHVTTEFPETCCDKKLATWKFLQRKKSSKDFPHYLTWSCRSMTTKNITTFSSMKGGGARSSRCAWGHTPLFCYYSWIPRCWRKTCWYFLRCGVGLSLRVTTSRCGFGLDLPILPL